MSIWDTFRDSVIEVEHEGALRPLNRPLASALLGEGSSFFVVTAWNPDALVSSPEANGATQARLEAELRASGVRLLPALGRDRASNWREESLAVFEVSAERALEIGRRYGQVGVFEVTRREVIVWDCGAGAPRARRALE